MAEPNTTQAAQGKPGGEAQKSAQRRARPLSPHLQVYRLPMAAIMSITHRLTGLVLSLGVLVVAGFIWAAAFSPDCYAHLQGLLATGLGQLALLGFTFAFCYHLCTGTRHLFWDWLIGFDKPVYQKTNWVVLLTALVLTAVIWAACAPHPLIFTGG